MLPSFRSARLESQYQSERKGALATKDMRSAVAFTLLWAVICYRFLGLDLLGLIKATAWLAAVGMKPVYVCKIVGKPFYTEYRAWIISFTKVVFAVHPPGEHLHLGLLALKGPPTALPGALWNLAEGIRLPYLWITGFGWADYVHNIPIQLALIARAMADNTAQCRAPYFQSAGALSLLGGVADWLSTTLANLMLLGGGGGLAPLQGKFPVALDACTVLGAWITFCLGFLLPTTVLYMAERQAKAKFAATHTEHMGDAERRYWEEAGVAPGTWVAVLTFLAYACLLLWQVAVSIFTWLG